MAPSLRDQLSAVAQRRIVSGGALIGGAMIGGMCRPFGGYFRKGKKNNLWYERRSKKYGYDPVPHLKEIIAFRGGDPSRYQNEKPEGYFSMRGAPPSAWQIFVKEHAKPIYRAFRGQLGDSMAAKRESFAQTMMLLGDQWRTMPKAPRRQMPAGFSYAHDAYVGINPFTGQRATGGRRAQRSTRARIAYTGQLPWVSQYRPPTLPLSSASSMPLIDLSGAAGPADLSHIRSTGARRGVSELAEIFEPPTQRRRTDTGEGFFGRHPHGYGFFDSDL